jgi:hypothetical protein
MKWGSLLLSLLFVTVFCGCPPTPSSVNLCQKDPATWECVVDGAAGILEYQPTGKPDFIFQFTAWNLDPATDYRLIYYDDTYSPWRSGKPLGKCLTEKLTPQPDGTLDVFNGSAVTGDLPWPDDLNCPTGAKIWLITDADANCSGPIIIAGWNPASYLLDETSADWVKFNDLTQTDQPCNEAPVADAGDDQGVTLGSLVTLDGSGSNDPEFSPLTYAWSFVSKPTGSGATLVNPTTVNPTFTADKDGAYVVQLVVYDGSKDSAPDTVTVTATLPISTANLCEKDSSWNCKSGGATATLTYNTVGNSNLEFTLTAQGLAASTDYTLVYYPDPWPGNGLICLGNGPSGADGTLTLTGPVTPGDLPKPYDTNCPIPGAKIWLVPTGYLNCVGQTMTWCNPGDPCTQIIFDKTQSDWITFDDLSDPNVCLP